MNNDQLRADFEASLHSQGISVRLLARESQGYKNLSIDSAWLAWKSAHAEYAPHWLLIDEVAKDGRLVDLWHPRYGRLTNCRWVDSGEYFHSPSNDVGVSKATHYMPIPDAPEVG